jgi:riboflavin kinase
MSELEGVVGAEPDELAALKHLGLEGGVEAGAKVSCSDLASRMGTSDQTASRRLQALEEDGLVEREMLSDGQWVEVTDGGETVLRREYDDYRRIFEGSGTVELVGEVVSGMGEGKYYISLDGYVEQFVDRLGYEPFAGTLNISLDDESTRRRASLENADGIPIDEWENEDRTFGAATCYEASVEGVDAHVIRPHRSHYPDDTLEVIAPVKLRDELGIDYGDEVTVEVRLG